INGVDFWRDLGPEKTGRIAVRGQPATSRDTLRAECELRAPNQQMLGTMRQQFRFARSGQNHIVDVEVTVRADQGLALKMGDTEEGALGFRFADEFKEDRGAVLTNSDGLVGTKQIWGKRAKWVDYSATLNGEKVGVTILDYPKNPKYPTYWHARGYGLNAANPFGEHDFHRDKSRDGSLTIPAGRELSFRYRIVIHSGALDNAAAQQWAKEFGEEK
ncbi:MAG: PmoA family protein, partial [Bryobacteraceae bacterium]